MIFLQFHGFLNASNLLISSSSGRISGSSLVTGWGFSSPIKAANLLSKIVARSVDDLLLDLDLDLLLGAIGVTSSIPCPLLLDACDLGLLLLLLLALLLLLGTLFCFRNYFYFLNYLIFLF